MPGPYDEVDPRYSPHTNQLISELHPTDGNMETLHDMGQQNGDLSAAFTEFVRMFGQEDAMSILQEVVGSGVNYDLNGQETPSRGISAQLHAAGAPPPDFGAQQPVTTLPPTDSNMMNLEDHYGFPVHAQGPNSPKGAPVYNGPPGMLPPLPRKKR